MESCCFFKRERLCKMEKLMDKVNLIGGSIAAVLMRLFGPMWILFAGFCVANVIDWLTGWKASKKEEKESSKVGAKGIVKKVGYWVVILIAFYIAYAFKLMGDMLGLDLWFLQFVGWFVLANYLVNEIRSILENLVRLGVKVPGFLTKGLKITSDLIDNAADGKLPKGEDKHDEDIETDFKE